ncbi:MAG TPA: restriction endonuclease subunit S [Candidatus Paceibacterota bacterium]|nr:restriction endonuclease subunit S [Verrucomicrobiota bacterium]HRZ44557.1 restriction endonuclease subunit S [Candidatus Paceibacterota bacterium]
MQTKALRELAEIRTGYPFRGGVDRVPEGGCLLVQAGNIDGEAGDLTGEPTRIVTPSNFREHVLHFADVLLIARGPRNDAATYTWGDGVAVAASHLMILRTAGRISFPDYLTWFLNLPATQAKIRAMRSESTVPFVSVEALGRLRVPVPSFDAQNAIAGIQKLSTQEQRLMEQLRRQRRVYVDGLLMEAVQRGCGGHGTNNQ